MACWWVNILGSSGTVPSPFDQLIGAVQIADAIGGAKIVEVLVDGQGVMQDHLLRAIAQGAAPEDLAPVGTQFARENFQQGGFACPILAHHAHQGTEGDLERDPLKHFVAPEGLLNVLDA